MTHNGTIIAKNPAMWSTKMIPSTRGRCFARKILKRATQTEIPIAINVPCHLSGA
jgi:hypothetical protein